MYRSGTAGVGSHQPESDYARDLNHLKAALVCREAPYAVTQARYWPSCFLIDNWGHLRYTQIGAGAYAQTEQAIQDLLQETYRGED